MAVNIRRLIVKRFGGTANFLTFILVTIVVYLGFRHYYSDDSEQLDLSTNNPIDQAIAKKLVITQQELLKPGNFIDDKTSRSNKTRPKLGETHPECVIDQQCTENQVPYKLSSGFGLEVYPVICFNGKLLLSKSLGRKVDRGINVVVLDAISFDEKLSETYDTFVEDHHFYRLLKGLDDGDILMMASYDEMSNGLRSMTHQLLESYGSQYVSTLKYRDAYVMIGQRGLAKGKAIEKVEVKGKNDQFAAQAKVSGCASIPIGTITPLVPIKMDVNSDDQIALGSVLKKCGMREDCKADEFAVHLYTGKNDKDEPKICIDGRYVMAKGVNDAGRGINIVVIGNGRQILKTAHFDTYAEDSTNLEIFLESLYDNVIVIVVTFDDASAKLSTLARNLFFELGSGLVQNLRHRDAWYLIGRKGINGFSPIEEISYAGQENAYPAILDRRFCVPQTLEGQKIRPDPLPNMNEERRDFCSRYDGYGDFCTNENIDKPLKPAPIINKTLEEHPVYATPILIVGGMSHNSLRMTLETVIMQPGIRPDLVYVCIDEKLNEQMHLIKLFGFQSVKLMSSYNYTEIFHKALAKIWSIGAVDKSKQTVIIIEEDLILSPDFLYFFTQVYDFFVNDPTLAAVSTWNSNSYLTLDGSASYIYRTDEFPGLGFMLKRSVYETYMQNRLSVCCNERAWNNWDLRDATGTRANLDVIIPDVSRVFHRPYDISRADFSYLHNLFNRKRKTNLIPFPALKSLAHMESREKYVQFLKDKLANATPFPNECHSNGTVEMPNTTKTSYKIVFEQKSEDDLSELKALCKCFMLFHHDDYAPKSLYMKSILRFNAHQNNYLLIGSLNLLLKN